MAPQGRKTSLRIIDCKQVYHGTNQKGDDYTIHEVKAAKADGSLVNEKLRSFTALPVGQTVEVTVVPYSSEQYGKSYTLYPTNQRAAGTTAQVNELTATVEQLGVTVSKLAQRVSELERRGGRPSEPAEAKADTDDLDAKFGADPPFE